jgi:hypothetical protein
LNLEQQNSVMGVSNFFSKLCAPCCGGMHHAKPSSIAQHS